MVSGINFSPIKPSGEPVDLNDEARVSQSVSLKPNSDKDGEPVTPISLPNEEIEINQLDFLQLDHDLTQKEELGDCLTELAHPEEPASDTASPTSSPTDSHSTQLAHPESVEATESSQQSAAHSPQQLAMIILGCKTWTAAIEAMDTAAATIGKQRQTVFKTVLKHIPNFEDRQHLVKLLAEHIRQFPRDQWAYSWLPDSSRQLKQKAITQAEGRNTDLKPEL